MFLDRKFENRYEVVAIFNELNQASENLNLNMLGVRSK